MAARRKVGPVEVYLEAGSKRVFAGAVDWPGWDRAGRDETAALEALAAARPRYAAALGRRFDVPPDDAPLEVVERVRGNATTDFGAPDAALAADARPVDDRELERLEGILQACWRRFDRTVERARGRELRKGPRGGGRELDAIVAHVVGAEAGYGRRIAAGPPKVDDDPWGRRADERRAVLGAFRGAVVEGLPPRGPRGGVLWTPRRFVRRAAWHVLDHAWEIEDRLA
jgi:hypothetical protein